MTPSSAISSSTTCAETNDFSGFYDRLCSECEDLDVRIKSEESDRVQYDLFRDNNHTGRVHLLAIGTELNIVSLTTQPWQTKTADFSYSGNGKSILRATFTHALDTQKFDIVTTSIFSDIGAGFFLSRGFYNRQAYGLPERLWQTKPITPKWERAQSGFSIKEIEQAQIDYGDGNDKEAFELANSEMGKSVLWMTGSCGYADLDDSTQINRIKEKIGLAL